MTNLEVEKEKKGNKPESGCFQQEGWAGYGCQKQASRGSVARELRKCKTNQDLGRETRPMEETETTGHEKGASCPQVGDAGITAGEVQMSSEVGTRLHVTQIERIKQAAMGNHVRVYRYK